MTAYTLQGSTDCSTWTTLYTGSGGTTFTANAGNTATVFNYVVTATFAVPRARCLRLTVRYPPSSFAPSTVSLKLPLVLCVGLLASGFLVQWMAGAAHGSLRLPMYGMR